MGERQSLLNGLLPPGTAALQAEWGIVSIQHGSASQLCAAKAVGHPSAKHSPQRLLGPPPPIPSCLPGGLFFSQIAAGGFGSSPPFLSHQVFNSPCLELGDARGETWSPGEGGICLAVTLHQQHRKKVMPGGNKHFTFISYSCYSPFSWGRAGSCPKWILLKHQGVFPTC